MLQNIITDLVCIHCGANLMADLAEDGALFDTAMGNGGTTGSRPTGFDCLPTRWTDSEWDGQYLPHLAQHG